MDIFIRLDWKTSPYPWVWILRILQRIAGIREYHCIPIIQLNLIYSFIYAFQRSSPPKSLSSPVDVSSFRFIPDYSFSIKQLVELEREKKKRNVSLRWRDANLKTGCDWILWRAWCEQWGFHNCMKHLNIQTQRGGTGASQPERRATICSQPIWGTAALVRYT